MKVLVTGASGFIGGRILDATLRKGWTGIGTSRTAIRSLEQVDITDPNTFAELRKRGPFDVVIHCAGIAHRFGGVSSEEYERVNALGTHHVARLSVECGAKHFIHISSVIVYGRHGAGIAETEECHPKDAYGASKLRAEEQAKEVASGSEMALTILRLVPVIGEGCKGNFQRLIRAVDRGRFINIGDGTPRKSIIYVGDVVNACSTLIESKRTNKTEIFNISGEATTTGQLLELISRYLGKPGPPFSLSSRSLSAVLNRYAGITAFGPFGSVARSLDTWLSDDHYSSEALRLHCGFSAATPIEEAVERTIIAYRASARS